MTLGNGLGGEHTGEWVPGAAYADNPNPNPGRMQPRLESGRLHGKRMGAGWGGRGQPRHHLPEPRLRGTQREVDPWDPDTTAPLGGGHASYTRFEAGAGLSLQGPHQALGQPRPVSGPGGTPPAANPQRAVAATPESL